MGKNDKNRKRKEYSTQRSENTTASARRRNERRDLMSEEIQASETVAEQRSPSAARSPANKRSRRERSGERDPDPQSNSSQDTRVFVNQNQEQENNNATIAVQRVANEQDRSEFNRIDSQDNDDYFDNAIGDDVRISVDMSEDEFLGDEDEPDEDDEQYDTVVTPVMEQDQQSEVQFNFNVGNKLSEKDQLTPALKKMVDEIVNQRVKEEISKVNSKGKKGMKTSQIPKMKVKQTEQPLVKSPSDTTIYAPGLLKNVVQRTPILQTGRNSNAVAISGL